MTDYADSNYKDVLIPCADCKAEFLWDAGEQDYYHEHHYKAPKRCPDCRAKRKREREKP